MGSGAGSGLVIGEVQVQTPSCLLALYLPSPVLVLVLASVRLSSPSHPLNESPRCTSSTFSPPRPSSPSPSSDSPQRTFEAASTPPESRLSTLEVSRLSSSADEDLLIGLAVARPVVPKGGRRVQQALHLRAGGDRLPDHEQASRRSAPPLFSPPERSRDALPHVRRLRHRRQSRKSLRQRPRRRPQLCGVRFRRRERPLDDRPLPHEEVRLPLM